MREKDMIRRLFIAMVFVLLSGGLLIVEAADYEGATVTTLKKSSVTEDGRPISYPRTQNPEVTAILVELPVGGETGWHQHPYPLYAFVLSGTLVVELDSGAKQVFCEGDVIIEVVNRAHNGKNTGSTPVKLVVFVTGEDGGPMTLKVPAPAMANSGE